MDVTFSASSAMVGAFKDDPEFCSKVMMETMKKTLTSYEGTVARAACFFSATENGRRLAECEGTGPCTLRVEYTIFNPPQIEGKESFQEVLKAQPSFEETFFEEMPQQVETVAEQENKSIDAAKLTEIKSALAEASKSATVSAVQNLADPEPPKTEEPEDLTYTHTIFQWKIDGKIVNFADCPCDKTRQREIRCTSSKGELVDLSFCQTQSPEVNFATEETCAACQTLAPREPAQQPPTSHSSKLALASCCFVAGVVFLLAQ
jgi:hypothetical protein